MTCGFLTIKLKLEHGIYKKAFSLTDCEYSRMGKLLRHQTPKYIVIHCYTTTKATIVAEIIRNRPVRAVTGGDGIFDVVKKSTLPSSFVVPISFYFHQQSSNLSSLNFLQLFHTMHRTHHLGPLGRRI